MQCENCGNDNEDEFIEKNGSRICCICSLETQGETYFANSFSDSKRCSFFSRSNYSSKVHFLDVLDFLEGKSRHLPDFVVERIKHEIDKYNISVVNHPLIVNMLKKLRFNKFIPNSNTILKNITGQCIDLSLIRVTATEGCPSKTEGDRATSLRDKIIDDFDKIDAEFVKMKLDQRKYSLNARYLLKKLLLRHGVNIELQDLKSRERLVFHDQVYQKICEILGWN
jgi:hypothetical protein